MYRIESDSIGEKQVLKSAYYGVQTLRAYENFHITAKPIPRVQIEALALIKKACAITNEKAKDLDKDISKAIQLACDDIIAGLYQEEFIVDQIQGGAGTSANMNANEVIANIGLEKLSKEKGDYQYCHPNDHVNMAQSTNDVYPTSLKIALYKTVAILEEKLDQLSTALLAKSVEFNDILKIGRTQLMDAVPMTLGQEFHAYATATQRAKSYITKAKEGLLVVNMGGTAIGTGINSSEYFYHNIVKELSIVSGLDLKQAEDMIDGTQHVDSFAHFSSSLKSTGVILSKIANDIRFLNGGPKAGLAEITIPAKQNGSSIMPGKINPVIPEVLNQAAFVAIGNDVTVTMACEAGQLELNAFEPVIYNRINETITVLVGAIDTFIHNCVVGIEANEERCKDLLYHSSGFVTALCPVIGYKAAAEIAKDFLKNGTPIIEGATKRGVSKEVIDELFNPDLQARRFEKK